MEDHISMRTRAAISFILLALVSGSAGYFLRARRTDGSVVLLARDVVREEYLAPPDSYSRVENTKNELNASCTRVRLGIQEAIVAYDRLAGKGETSNWQAAEFLERRIRDAERAVREFEGTDQQLYVLQELLRLLERAGRFDAWTQHYLKALYRDPTHPVISRFATAAVRISKLAGQQRQVLDALRHLTALPTEMAGRSEIEAALDSVQPRLARLDAHSGCDVICGFSFASK
jgi:hypothetical protein